MRTRDLKNRIRRTNWQADRLLLAAQGAYVRELNKIRALYDDLHILIVEEKRKSEMKGTRP